MAIPAPRRRFRRPLAGRMAWAWAWLWLGGCALLVGAGCQGTALNRWRMATDDSLSRAPTREELGDDRGLFARLLRPEGSVLRAPQTNSISNFILDRKLGWRAAPSPPDPEAEREFAAAEQLFQQGELSQAESAFARLARRKKDTSLGEKAQFYLAETQFQRRRYRLAHDSYETLFQRYPGTRFLDKAVEREYAIAKFWLADADPEGKPEERLAWYTAFTGARPLLDPHGFAIKAFEHVRHHDPTGPLADDAALQIAEQYYRDQDYETAAIYYDQLITDHPKSPLVKRAMLSAIDAKLKGYIGPEYDATGLEQAAQTVQRAKTYFPELRVSTDTEPDELDHTLDLIDDQMAERTYKIGEYYRRAGHPGAARYYYTWVTQRWPKSPWTPRAEEQLEALAHVKDRRAQISKIMTLPGSTDPFTGNSMTGAQGSPMSGPNGMMGP
jgi:outer membrane assembly lipoprotein YfiO